MVFVTVLWRYGVMSLQCKQVVVPLVRWTPLNWQSWVSFYIFCRQKL